MFYFSTLYISCYTLQSCKVFAEKSTDKLLRIPLYTTLCFSLAPFRILSFTFVIFIVIFCGVSLGSSWLWPSVLLVPGYLFSSSDSGNFWLMHFQFPSHFLLLLENFGMLQFSSIQSLSLVRLCDPMGCRMPGFPVLHQLPELAQTHAHWVGDAI